MVNIYVDRLNPMLKKDYEAIEKKCERMIEYNASAYDVMTFLNDYLYDLSPTVNNNYFLAISTLEDFYYNL